MAKKRKRAPRSYRKRFQKRKQAQEQKAQLEPTNDIIDDTPPKPTTKKTKKKKRTGPKRERKWTKKEEMVRMAIVRDTDWVPSHYLVKKVVEVAGKARTNKRYKESIGQAARTVEFVIGKGVRKKNTCSKNWICCKISKKTGI